MKKKTVGIICAMESEWALLSEKLQNACATVLGGMEFRQGKIGETQVILALCGIGKVFAAMCAQTMILTFSPDLIINSGVAGSLSAELDVLDLCISSALVQHDMDTSPLGDPAGLVSGINIVDFPADAAAAERLLAIAREKGMRAISGKIASGDRFVADRAEKEAIGKKFGAVACEMEGAAMAQVCYCNRVPFCAVRAISDSLTGGGAMEYEAFVHEAAARSAKLLLTFLGE